MVSITCVTSSNNPSHEHHLQVAAAHNSVLVQSLQSNMDTPSVHATFQLHFSDLHVNIETHTQVKAVSMQTRQPQFNWVKWQAHERMLYMQMQRNNANAVQPPFFRKHNSKRASNA